MALATVLITFGLLPSYIPNDNNWLSILGSYSGSIYIWAAVFYFVPFIIASLAGVISLRISQGIKDPMAVQPVQSVFIIDCNGNGIDDMEDIVAGFSIDAYENGVPDECERPIITIEKTHNTLQGMYEYVSITIENSDLEMGGFDFLIAYDASALTFMEATPGQLLEDCDWEYFTYRYGAFGNCGDACRCKNEKGEGTD